MTLSTAEYMRAIELCRAAVDAHWSDDGGPMVAGSVLADLRDLLAPSSIRVATKLRELADAYSEYTADDLRWHADELDPTVREAQKRTWVAQGGDPDVWECEHPH